MAITIEQLEGYLKEEGVRFTRHTPDALVMVFGGLERYRDEDGDDALAIRVRVTEDGEFLAIEAPKAFVARGPHVDAFLRACAVVQWRTKLVQFEYDANDGEIRPIVEIPVEDGTITKKQFMRSLIGLVKIIDTFYEPLQKALADGVVELEPGYPAGAVPADLLRGMLMALPEEQRRQILEALRRRTEGGSGEPH